MSADLLRRAATKIREEAQAATPGPWEVVIDHHREFECPEVSVWSQHEQAYVTEDVHTGNSQFKANAEHVATWQPDVAVAVADWLDATATDLDESSLLDAPDSDEGQPPNPEALWCDYCGGAIDSPSYPADDQRCACDRWSKALVVARRLLGEDA